MAARGSGEEAAETPAGVSLPPPGPAEGYVIDVAYT